MCSPGVLCASLVLFAHLISLMCWCLGMPKLLSVIVLDSVPVVTVHYDNAVTLILPASSALGKPEAEIALCSGDTCYSPVSRVQELMLRTPAWCCF